MCEHVWTAPDMKFIRKSYGGVPKIGLPPNHRPNYRWDFHGFIHHPELWRYHHFGKPFHMKPTSLYLFQYHPLLNTIFSHHSPLFNPSKSHKIPLNHHFPMVFLWFFWGMMPHGSTRPCLRRLGNGRCGGCLAVVSVCIEGCPKSLNRDCSPSYGWFMIQIIHDLHS